MAYKVINKALDITRDINNEDQEINLLENWIHELVDQKRYSEALTEIKALFTNYQLDKESIISLKNKEGIVLMELNDLENAKKSYETVLSIAQKTNRYYGYALHNIAEIHVKNGNYSEAEKFYLQAIGTKFSVDTDHHLVRSYIDLAKVYIQEKNYLMAINYLKEAELIDTGKYSIPENCDIYKLMGKIYKKLGDEQKEIHYKNIYLKKLSEREPTMELLTERHLDLLKIITEKEKTERLAQWGIAGMALFLFLLICIYIKYYRAKSNIKGEITKLIKNLSRPVM